MKPDMNMMKLGWQCRCPKCHTGDLYPSKLSMDVSKTCNNCGLKLGACDTADGPAVFLIFILGSLLVPLALIIEFTLAPPLWLHTIVWSAATLGLTLGMLRPVKAYIIALEYKHRPKTFK